MNFGANIAVNQVVMKPVFQPVKTEKQPLKVDPYYRYLLMMKAKLRHNRCNDIKWNLPSRLMDDVLQEIDIKP